MIEQNTLTVLCGGANAGRTTAALRIAIEAAKKAQRERFGPVIIVTAENCAPDETIKHLRRMGCTDDVLAHIRVASVTTSAELAYVLAYESNRLLLEGDLASASRRMPSMVVVDDIGLLDYSTDSGRSGLAARKSAYMLHRVACGQVAWAFAAATGLDASRVFTTPVIQHPPVAVVVTVRTSRPGATSNTHTSSWEQEATLVLTVTAAAQTITVEKTRYGAPSAA
jgi:hypothetical protein